MIMMPLLLSDAAAHAQRVWDIDVIPHQEVAASGACR